MTIITEGEYKQGRIELFETPAGLREGRVRVVLIEASEKQSVQPLQFGKYQSGIPSTEEDFHIAEWRGD